MKESAGWNQLSLVGFRDFKFSTFTMHTWLVPCVCPLLPPPMPFSNPPMPTMNLIFEKSQCQEFNTTNNKQQQQQPTTTNQQLTRFSHKNTISSHQDNNHQQPIHNTPTSNASLLLVGVPSPIHHGGCRIDGTSSSTRS